MTQQTPGEHLLHILEARGIVRNTKTLSAEEKAEYELAAALFTQSAAAWWVKRKRLEEQLGPAMRAMYAALMTTDKSTWDALDQTAEELVQQISDRVNQDASSKQRANMPNKRIKNRGTR